MGKTSNRTPLSVKVYPSNDRFFTQSNWKGICTDKNYLNIDQETFEDSTNVYLDDDFVLKSRPAINFCDVLPSYVFITKLWNLSKYVYVYDKNGMLYEINKADKTYKRCTVYAGTLLGELYNIIEYKTSILMFTSNGTFSIKNGDIYADVSGEVYIPETGIHSYVETNGQIMTSYKTGEERNILVNKEKISHIFDKVNKITYTSFVGKDVTVKIDGDETQIPDFSAIDENRIVGRLGTLPTEFISSDKSNISFSKNGQSIIAIKTDKPTEYRVYVSFDKLAYAYVGNVLSNVVPKISDDGDCFYTVLGNKVTTYSTTNIEDTEVRTCGMFGASAIGVSIQNRENYTYVYRDGDYYIETGYMSLVVVIGFVTYDGVKGSRSYRVVFKDGTPIMNEPAKVSFVDAQASDLSVGKLRYVQICVATGDTYLDHYVYLTLDGLNISSTAGDTITEISYTLKKDFWLSELDCTDMVSTAVDATKVHYFAFFADGELQLSVNVISTRANTIYNLTTFGISSDAGYKGIIKIGVTTLEKLFDVTILAADKLFMSTNSVTHTTNYDITTDINDFDVVELLHKDVIPFAVINKRPIYGVKQDIDCTVYGGDLSSLTVIISYIVDFEASVPFFSKTVTTNALYAAVDDKLYISTNYDKLYIPVDREIRFNDTITNMQVLSSTRIGIFLPLETWYIDDVNGEQVLSKSKLAVGCKEDSDVLVSPDGSSIIVPTKFGLATLSYQQFVQSSDQVVQYLSEPINEQYVTFNKQPIKLYKHRQRIYCYNNSDTIYILDYRNMSWWKWRFDAPITGVLVLGDDIHFVIDDTFVCFNNSNDYYDYDELNVNWNIKSQKLHFGALHLYKNIKSIMFNNVQNDIKTVSFKLAISNYGTVVSDKFDGNSFIEYDVDLLRTFVKKCNSRKVNEFQYILSNDDETLSPTELSLHSIIIKYNFGGQVK